MTTVSSIGSSTASAATGTSSASSEQTIARLRKQEAALMEKLKQLQSSDGNSDTIAKQEQLLQQQISAIELQIARIESRNTTSSASAPSGTQQADATTAAAARGASLTSSSVEGTQQRQGPPPPPPSGEPPKAPPAGSNARNADGDGDDGSRRTAQAHAASTRGIGWYLDREA